MRERLPSRALLGQAGELLLALTGRGGGNGERCDEKRGNATERST
jgi:hypothetical protein